MDDDAGGRERSIDGQAGRRHTRWAGLVGFTVRRTWKRATATVTGRIVATIAAVTLTIAFLLVITGIALAVADSGVTAETDADVTIAPESSGALSTVDGVEEPRFGDSTDRAETIESESGVDHVSPSLHETVRLDAGESEPQTVLLVGVVPDDEPRTVAGLSTDELGATASDGTDSEHPSLVLSPAAAERLGVSVGDEVTVSTVREDGATLTVAAVEGQAGTADEPVALVDQQTAQAIAGVDDDDLATQLLVWGDASEAESAATDAYPHATVDSTADGDPSTLFGDGLALATSLLALVVGVTICAAFVATTMGLTIEQDRRTLAVLEAIGFSVQSRLAVVVLTTGITTLAGAVGGLVLGVLGIITVNAIATTVLTTGPVATMTPLFVPYAIAVSLISGLVATPYPLAVAVRTSVIDEVGR